MTPTDVKRSETEMVIGGYHSALLTEAEWRLAGPMITGLVRADRPETVEHARVALSYLSRFLWTCSAWDRTTEPDFSRVFSREQFAHVDAVLATTGIAVNTRRNVATVVRRLVGKSLTSNRKRPLASRQQPELPVVSALKCDSTQWQIRSWLSSRLGTGANLAALDKALREIACRTGLTDGFLSAVLAYLAPVNAAKFSSYFADAVTPVPRRAKQPAAPQKRTSAAAARRAAKASANEMPTHPKQPELHADIRHLIEDYCPRTLTAAEFAPNRDLTTAFVASSAPASLRNARRLLSYSFGYVVWVRSHADANPSVSSLCNLNLLDRYITNGLAHLSEGTRSTQRSTLTTAIGAILSGGRRRQALKYRGGSAPYTPAEEQSMILLARHQPNSLRRARLSSVVALGAGAGLDSGDMRGIRPCDIEICVLSGTEVIQVHVHSGRRPRTVILRNSYRKLLLDALMWHAEAGRNEESTLLGAENTRNVASRVVEHSVNATREPVVIEAVRLRATWLLAVMSQPVPLTVILQAAGLQSARPIADLVPYLPEPDPAEYARVIAGESK